MLTALGEHASDTNRYLKKRVEDRKDMLAQSCKHGTQTAMTNWNAYEEASRFP